MVPVFRKLANASDLLASNRGSPSLSPALRLLQTVQPRLGSASLSITTSDICDWQAALQLSPAKRLGLDQAPPLCDFFLIR